MTKIKSFADENSSKNWLVIEFCKLGFIGKMFKITDLPIFIHFFIIFFKDKPVDWLLIDVIRTKVCSPEMDEKTCDLATSKKWIQYKGLMFVHIGTHSSLGGKVWSNEGQKMDENKLSKVHQNLSSNIETSVDHLKREYKLRNEFRESVSGESKFLKSKLRPPRGQKGFRFKIVDKELKSDPLANTAMDVQFVRNSFGRKKAFTKNWL